MIFSMKERNNVFFCSILCFSNLAVLLLLVSVGSSFVGIVDSQCNRKPVIFNFGDSNSDTGGFCYGNGVTFGPPTGRVFFHQPSGRLCDGRLIIDFLCESLNMSYLNPYMQTMGANFTNGANFAVSGSATQPEHKSFNLDIQIGQFLQFQANSLGPTSNGFKDLVSEDFNSALYTVDIGQNDLAASLSYLSYSKVIQKIPSFIAEIQTSIMKLYENGAKNFWVHNTGPLGCLPLILAISSHDESDFDKFGCLEPYNNVAKEFNNQLNALCEKLRSELSDATIVYNDVYSIKYGVITNPSLYGFENPLMACCGYGGPPYNFKVNHTCGGSNFTVCDDIDGTKFISWDGVHYSESANSVFASKLLSAHYSTPPLNFQYFCNS